MHAPLLLAVATNIYIHHEQVFAISSYATPNYGLDIPPPAARGQQQLPT